MHVFVSLLTVTWVQISSAQNNNNVCKSYLDYATIKTNENCWHNPDIYSTPVDIIRRRGYSLETHRVVTDDGYVLSLYRVFKKHENSNSISFEKPIVYLQHGIATDSMFWVTFEEKSLAFKLADLGCDVWLGNIRGSAPSYVHINGSLSPKAYWSFSFHEMGYYDLPAIFSLISKLTGSLKKIVYIGHSMGTTISYVYASTRTEHANEHLKGIISLTPIATVRNITSALSSLIPIRNQLINTFNILGIYHLNINENFRSSCRNYQMFGVCLKSYYSVFGYGTDNLAPKDLPAIFINIPSTFSTRTLLHYAQIVGNGGEFRQLDLGYKENKRIYGSDKPPIYDLGNITLPVHLLYAKADAFATKHDVYNLLNKLGSKVKTIQSVPSDKYQSLYNHLDVVCAKDADVMVFPILFDLINSFD